MLDIHSGIAQLPDCWNESSGSNSGLVPWQEVAHLTGVGTWVRALIVILFSISSSAQAHRLGFDPDRNYYADLGLEEGEKDEAVIREAYRSLARENHPDLKPGDAVAEQRFIEAAEAYDVLSDPEVRRRYDIERARVTGNIAIRKSTAAMSDDELARLDYEGLFLGVLPEQILERDSLYVTRMKVYGERLVEAPRLTGLFVDYGDYGRELGQERTILDSGFTQNSRAFLSRLEYFIFYESEAPRVAEPDRFLSRASILYDLWERKYRASALRKFQRGRWSHWKAINEEEVLLGLSSSLFAQGLLLRRADELRQNAHLLQQSPDYWLRMIQHLEQQMAQVSRLSSLELLDKRQEDLRLLKSGLLAAQKQNAKLFNRIKSVCARASAKVHRWLP